MERASSLAHEASKPCERRVAGDAHVAGVAGVLIGRPARFQA
jgi:hypothetical protein